MRDMTLRALLHRTLRHAGLVIGLCCALLGGAAPVRAQGIESVMAPGKLIQGHAKYEDDCKQCHVKLDRKAQDGLCMACHKAVGADVRGRKGYHGRLDQPMVCKSCHTEHKGRDMKVVVLEPTQWDHNKTDYTLKGKHEKVECVKCHVAGRKWREAAQTCIGCHEKDDKHKGTLGGKCADCHTEKDWKEARFDHETTRFPLTGKHVDVKCLDCHKDSNYKDTPKSCVACHRKMDEQKGHKGLFGEKCETCHVSKAWKPSIFNHDADTNYMLRGKHHTVVCKACHTAALYKDKTPQDCWTCHKKDDKHKDTLGRTCQTCHTEKTWKEVARFEHAKTDFPLLGKHAKVECKACHASPLYKEAAKDCYSCHQKDDKHKSNLGRNCADCHAEQDWKTTRGRFDHERTQFKLRNAHADPKVACLACHKDFQSYRNTPLACIGCHKKDDKHETQLGDQCERCHADKNWQDIRFDHARAAFALTGRHLIAECKTCHATLRYKDAPRDCLSCHKKNDKHKGVFGMRCEICHNTRSWPVWSFDHDTRTQYRLEGAHAPLTCDACHRAVAPAGKDAAPLGKTCITCHRSKDIHGGSFGPRCDACHQVTDWKKFKGRVGETPVEQAPGSIHNALPGGLQ